MILGIGTDIVEIERISAVLTHHAEHFSARVFTAAEADQARGRVSYLAGRWAAKEAAAKALAGRTRLRWHVSISHEKAYAVATVILESAE